MPEGVSVRSVPRAQAETGSVVTANRKLRNAANILFHVDPPYSCYIYFIPCFFLLYTMALITLADMNNPVIHSR